MKALCFGIVFLFHLFLYVKGENFCKNKTADECIDIVIRKAIQKIPHPSNLSDFETNVLSRGIELTEGLLWGFDKLKRMQPMSFRINEHYRVFLGKLGIDTLSVRYKWTSAFRHHIRSGNVVFKASNITTRFHVELNYDSKSHPVIEYLNIYPIENTEVEVSGLDYLGWLASALTDDLKNRIKDIVKSFVDNKIRNALQKELYQVRFPVDLEELPEPD